MKRLLAKLALFLFFLSLFQSFSLIYPKKLTGANLTNVRDILLNSRLSFVGALDSGNIVGSSLIRIKLSGDSPPSWATSVKNFNLFPGDSLMVGNNVNYEVDDIVDDASDDLIQLTSALQSGDADADDPVIATASARHTVEFTTVSTFANGAVRVKIAAAASAADDGIPDASGFDFGPITASDITCPAGGGATWESPTATASGGTGCASGYHCFECRYNGTLNSGLSLTVYIGGTAEADQLINPAPSSTSKTIGSADTHAFIVQHLNSSYEPIDTTTGKVAVVEPVRVTAIVESTLEFTIAGESSGNSRCGQTTDVTTTAATVPLGTLSISSFTDASQKLTVSTNADSGYSVTVIEDDQLGKGGATSPYIPDSPGDAANMTHTAKADWDDPADSDAKGFSYSLQNVDALSIAFQYSDTDGNCSGTTYCGKQFPATADVGDTAQEIFSSTTVANAEDVYICYKAVISATQEAGDYENAITFVATAKF